MKKNVTLIIATLLLSVCTPLSAFAYDVVAGGICYNLDTEEKTAEVTSGDNKYSGEITVPHTITVDGVEYYVNSIGANAFAECPGLTSVTIPSSVASIGKSSFKGCSGLTSLTIPNSVASIGDAAFAGCNSLTSITVAPGNTIYDSRDNCNAIIRTDDNTLIAGCQSTNILSSVTGIGDAAFWGCTNLTSVTIPNSVTSIGKSAFYECSGLTSINPQFRDIDRKFCFHRMHPPLLRHNPQFRDKYRIWDFRVLLRPHLCYNREFRNEYRRLCFRWLQQPGKCILSSGNSTKYVN